MISDTLHDACEEMLEYLTEFHEQKKFYMGSEEYEAWLISVFAQMNALRYYLDQITDRCDEFFNVDFIEKLKQVKTLKDLDDLGVNWK